MTPPFSTFPEVLQFTTVILSLSTLAFTILDKRRMRLKERADEWDGKIATAVHNTQTAMSKINEVERRMERMQTQIEVFWKGVSYSSSQALHSPHTPELDALIEKYQRDEITSEELIEFKNMLRAIVTDPKESVGRKKSARETLLTIHIRYEMTENVSALTNMYYDIRNLFGDLYHIANMPPSELPEGEEHDPTPPGV